MQSRKVKNRMLREIPKLATAADVLMWSLMMSADFDALDKADRDELSAAVITHQSNLISGRSGNA